MLPPPAAAPIVFFDIAGPDLKTQAAFYRDVFSWTSDAEGRLQAPAAPAGRLEGALRADPPAKVLYIGVDDVAGRLQEVVAHGGRVVAPRFEVKGRVVLGLFTDPAGNVMGLVEMAGDQPKVP